MADKTAILRLDQVHSGYGDIQILRGIDLELHAGEVTAVIGANGAGKSTLLKTIAGVVQVTAGDITFDSEAITGRSTKERLGLGIVLVPQGRCNFPLMTVNENLEMGAFTRRDKLISRDIDAVYERFPVLGTKRNIIAGNMSGGEQQLLEMSMALMLSPRVILLDEPSLGLSHKMQQEVFSSISQLRDGGVSVLMVEQNAVQALGHADHGVVIELGRVARIGTGVAMLDDPEVRRAYLGLPS